MILNKAYAQALKMIDESAFICEDAEGKNINRAEKFIKQNYAQYLDRELTLPNGDKKKMSARDWVTQVRNDIPSSRLPKTENGKDSCKFLLGVTRLYFGFTKDSRQDEIQGKISQLEKIMKILTTSHASEYDNDLNGLSYGDLDNKFKRTIQKNLDNEIASLKDQQFTRDESYKFIPIPDFKTAKRFGKWTSWCVTHQESMYDSYTKYGLGLFYFCIKDGFETVKKVESEGSPLDEYGKSMIAISVNNDGSLNTATCRWNHDNGGNDKIFKDAAEVSRFFGVNFFETFKPRTVDKLLDKYKKNAIASKIASKLGGVETEDGLHLVKNRRVLTYKKIYTIGEKTCYAYDHFYWFNEDGNQIAAPQNVSGSFYCSNCTSLTSLEGAPKEVGGAFVCNYCTSLTSLEGAPQKVGGDFYCNDCKSLTSLEGAPKEVGRAFVCNYCTSLTSLEGAPQKVGGNFYCNDCKSLTSLKGAPKEIKTDFSCSDCNSLTSLEGAPKEVGGDFICYDCTSLTSLKGAPKEVGGDFYCNDCVSLTSLEGAPQKVGGDFYCNNCNQLTSLEGAPQKVGRNFDCDSKLNDQKQEYLVWLKTNPKENYKELKTESTNMIDLKKVYEDAVMAAGDAGVAVGDIAPASSASAGDADIVPSKGSMTTTDDVLGKHCDHHKDGYLGPECFHVPARARHEIPSKKRKGWKNPYTKGMKVITDADKVDEAHSVHSYKGNAKATYDKVLATLGTEKPYVDKLYFSEEFGFGWKISKKGYLKAYRPVKVTLNKTFSHYSIYEYRLEDDNTLNNISSYGYYDTKDQAIDEIRKHCK